ncbi:MAG: amidohydrolase [Chitinophagales bacterium]|nr:amidohydrolase [Chitinophagales bacterium]
MQAQAKFKVALVQANIHWENVQKNIEHFNELLKQISAVDLIVLPEMFTTGFSINTELAKENSTIALPWLQATAKEKNAVMCGSVIIEESQSFYNRLFWVEPSGRISTYDKRHLFSLSEEPKHFSAGKERLIVEYKGWKFCPLVCYDLRFPVWSRNQDNYNVLLYIASWPQKRDFAWNTLLPARAIENQSYVIGVNRIGIDGNGLSYSGNSAVYDALGEKLFSNSVHQESIKIATLDFASQQKNRTKLPFLNDRDSYSIYE